MIDDWFGDILDEVDRLGIGDNTLVVFMASAGMEHGDWRLAPMYQDQMAMKKRLEEEEKGAAAAGAGAAGKATSEK